MKKIEICLKGALWAALMAGCAGQKPLEQKPPAAQTVNDCSSCVVVQEKN